MLKSHIVSTSCRNRFGSGQIQVSLNNFDQIRIFEKKWVVTIIRLNKPSTQQNPTKPTEHPSHNRIDKHTIQKDQQHLQSRIRWQFGIAIECILWDFQRIWWNLQGLNLHYLSSYLFQKALAASSWSTTKAQLVFQHFF